MFFYSLDKLVELLSSFASVYFGADGLWLHYHQFQDGSQSAEEPLSLICCCALAAAAAFHFRSPEPGCCGSIPPSVRCILRTCYGKVSAQPHTIVKQICFPNGNVLFLSLFSLFKNWMHNVGWGCAEILPMLLFLIAAGTALSSWFCPRSCNRLSAISFAYFPQPWINCQIIRQQSLR